MLSVPPAFAQAEIDYRQQRVKAEFSARAYRPSGSGHEKTGRRSRLAALFTPRRRPNLAARRPLPAPHH
ncbi:MAG TPA: hypothetical protein VHD81_02175 [Mycobacteriales bacterium]|nr:hypothetical protein [Mycobacteriales bacterium]